MELCGDSLHKFVLDAKQRIGRKGLQAIDVVNLGLQLADAIHALHRRAKYVHLDIKPGNIMLTKLREGEDESTPRTVKLIDFGISQHLPSSVDTTMMTGIGIISSVNGSGVDPLYLLKGYEHMPEKCNSS
jgi:serine/threonine protein kinase